MNPFTSYGMHIFLAGLVAGLALAVVFLVAHRIFFYGIWADREPKQRTDDVIVPFRHLSNATRKGKGK